MDGTHVSPVQAWVYFLHVTPYQKLWGEEKKKNKKENKNKTKNQKSNYNKFSGWEKGHIVLNL